MGCVPVTHDTDCHNFRIYVRMNFGPHFKRKLVFLSHGSVEEDFIPKERPTETWLPDKYSLPSLVRGSVALSQTFTCLLQ
jgi:hypothetical protein